MVRSLANFEVVEIVDDTNPYLMLLGIKWDFNNKVIINMKKSQIIFKFGYFLVMPLDPKEGECYVKLMRGNLDMVNF